MKKLVILAVVVAAVILAGCNPCKRLARKCPSHDSTFVLVETIRDTLWLESPADSLAMAIPIETLIDLSDLGLVFEDEDQKVSVKVVFDTLFIKSKCKEDSLQAIVDHLKTTITSTQTIYEEVEVEVPVKHVGKFARFCIIFFFCAVFLAAMVIVYRIKVGMLKTLVNRFQNPLGK